MNPPPPFPLFHPSQLPQPPTLSATTTTAASPTTSGAPDLPTVVSTLKSLLRLTETTLSSLSPLLPSPAPSPLIPCPFNRNHLLPPSSLFSHYLSCSSSPSPLDSNSILQSLHYPKTLHSSSKNSFTQPLQNHTSSELCFSLENFFNLSQNFFYSNCPGAVIIINHSKSNDFSSSSLPMLTLPGYLSAECANFTHINGCRSLDEKGFDVESIRLLPSEIWAVRNEIELWVDYPSSYSFRVLRCILRLCKSNLLCLGTWVIVNSPKYGVVIDLPMRDHIVLLFKLCLKAVIREAIDFANSIFRGKGEDKKVGLDKKIFGCPVFINVMMWLGSQLSVMYGEVSGKYFALNMLKQCVLDSALSSSLFPVVEKAIESPELKEFDGKHEGPFEKSGENEKKIMVDESVQNNMIFVSQVAAAVAALYERSWLEEKIKTLRDTRPLSAYQRVVEHEYITKRAHEERQKRSDYRPIIEYDGVLWQRANNQEPNRIKTREELLAEERDYKRRRMSYRGKKMKRTTTQVMRDIIDEFMDEIKQAGGLGFAKEAEEVDSRALESSSLHNNSSDVLEPQKNPLALQLSSTQPLGYGAQLHCNDGRRSMDSKDKYVEHSKQHKHDSQLHHENQDNDRSIKRARHDRKNYSRSPDRRQNGYHSHGYTRNQGTRDDPEAFRAIMSQKADGNLSKSKDRKSHYREEYGHNSKHRDSHTKKKHKDRRSDSLHTEFDDRYNQSESYYNYEDDA